MRGAGRRRVVARRAHLAASTALSALAALAALSAAGCSDKAGPEVPPPPRVLAIAASPRTTPPPTADDFIAAVDSVVSAGARAQSLMFTWSSLEPSRGTYEVAEFAFTVVYLGYDRELYLSLNVAPINTTEKEVPADLAAVPFDSSAMQDRFRALIDVFAPHVSDQVLHLTIGNEVDVYLAETNEWSAYRAFYEDAAAYVREKLDHVKVGVCVTHTGATGPFADSIAALNATSDVWVTTFYPLGAGFRPTGPDAATAALPEMVALAGGRPVVVQEIGYPSSIALESSDAEQAAFFANAFDAWGAAGGAIPFLSVFALHDFPTATCDELAAYYGLPDDAAFKAFLCSLGLLRVDGTAKDAWQVVKDGAAEALASGKGP